MIPASVTPSVSANASSAGALFPLMEPTSAELAEFDQLLGDFNQGSSITALSAPALTLSHGASFATSNQAKTPTTPEDLLATIEQGAQLAFQTPQIAMVIPTNQSLTDEQTMPVLNQGSNNITSQVQFEAVSDPLTSSPIEKTSPTASIVSTFDAKPALQKPSIEESSSISDKTQNHATWLLAASNQIDDHTSRTLLNQKVKLSNVSLTEVMTSPIIMPQRQDIPLTQVSDDVYQTSSITNLTDVLALNNLAVTTGNAPNMMNMPNQQIPLPAQNKEALATTIAMAASEALPIEARSPSLQGNGASITEPSLVKVNNRQALFSSVTPNQQILLPAQNKEALATTIAMAASEALPIEARSPSLQVNGAPITEHSLVKVNNQQALFSSVTPMPTKTTVGLTTPTSVETANAPRLDVNVLTEDPLLASQYAAVATESEAENLTTSARSMPLGYVQLLTPANLQMPETKVSMPNQYAAAPIVVTTPTSVAVTENSMASRMTEGVDLPLSVPLLGDNKAVVFASVPSVSVASTGIMQAASSGVEMPSTSQMLNSLASASAIIANPTAGSGSGATQQDQRQASSQSDRLMPSSEETQSISDVELGADEFSLLSTTPLSQTASQSILSAPLNLRQPQWAQDVAQRVQVMINQSMDELEVRLDPLGLGPMKIGLKLDEQQKAHVTLSAQHGVTREMLENALPRLKELLAQEGIELASATVDSGEKQTGNEQNSAQSSHQSASDLSEDAANTTVSMTVTSSSEHLVDQFA
ncbi:MAG: flagellar hook-length control protein FliK [Gammaproteobacteria bacterium]|nr:flagellar hook-length control protein FliK [Gammaproteobacteria bacterium]